MELGAQGDSEGFRILCVEVNRTVEEGNGPVATRPRVREGLIREVVFTTLNVCPIGSRVTTSGP